eukprot:TRINITY_DN11278_c0_g1_i2.p1 TRINITY_DN11278_c0_g1~~TRINITY_DN11278_c0_g1_i2.p1  ORF type:complete len:217 (-),score=29.73 TRINITY_DN11278_c0_g1_i2:120-770(-)
MKVTEVLLVVLLVWVGGGECWKYEVQRSLIQYQCFVRSHTTQSSFLKLPFDIHTNFFESSGNVLSNSWDTLNSLGSVAFSAIRSKTCQARSDPFQALNKNLSMLIGQSAAQNLIQAILHEKHFTFDPSPTLLHFYGPAATGKTLTAQIIAESLFKFDSYADKSTPLLVIEPEHFSTFDAASAKSNLTSLLFEQLSNCPKSIILFDDFHKFTRYGIC